MRLWRHEFGAPFIANRDLPRRLREGADLNEANPSTFYFQGAEGYIDYPSLAELLEACVNLRERSLSRVLRILLMLYVVATIKTNPGCRDKVLSELLRVQPMVQREEGCLQYAPLVDEANLVPVQADYREDVVTVLEQWASVAHLEAHLVSAHMQEYGQVVEPWVADVCIRLLREDSGS